MIIKKTLGMFIRQPLTEYDVLSEFPDQLSELVRQL